MDPKIGLKQAEMQQKQQEHQDNMQLAVAKLKAEIALNDGKIAKLQAEAELALAKADGVDKEQAIQVLNAQIGAAHADNESLKAAADLLLKSHQVNNELEQGHHQRIMDVHDRLAQQKSGKEAAAQEGEAK
jgi:ATP/maltotriose-dependent transcriptional regulator MalT